MKATAPDRELRRLVDAWHDGTISRDDAAALEGRIAADEEAARYFFEISHLEAALPGAAADLFDGAAVIPLPVSRRWDWQRVAGIAAVFMIGAFSGALVWKMQGPGTPVVAVNDAAASTPRGAMITGMLGVTWNEDAAVSRLELAPGADEASFDSGLMELTFASGTRAVIEGPAGFQVTGPNQMRLTYGKVVANVPKGAEGFQIDSRDGKVIDLGTEFAMDVPREGLRSTLGVFRGEIEFHPRDGKGEVLRLTESEAMRTDAFGGESVPFQRSEYHRELPSRDFSWELAGKQSEQKTLEFDVSHLIWKHGRYRAVCKWMSGSGGVRIHAAELLLEGTRVAIAERVGFAGDVHLKPDNVYDLEVPEGMDRSGRWQLRLTLAVQSANPKHAADARGVVLFEQGLATQATAKDFTGTWEYLYNGRPYYRTYRADGSADLRTKEGVAETFRTARWRVEDGLMILDVPEDDGTWVAETHVLRDAKTLIFANQPYANAKRIGDGK